MIPQTINNVKHLNKVIMGSIKGIKFELTKLSDDAIKTMDSFMNGELQKVYDEKDNLIKLISEHNKKINSVKTKFKNIEDTKYLAAYNDINTKAKELGVAPSDVQGLVDLDKKYSFIKRKVSELTNI
jgi:predicted  nucleic acid-binding Zn-ribbon protein